VRESRRYQDEQYVEIVNYHENEPRQEEEFGTFGRQVRQQIGRSWLVSVVQFQEKTEPQPSDIQQVGDDSSNYLADE